MGLLDIFKFKEYKKRAEYAEKRMEELGFEEYDDTIRAIKEKQEEAEGRIRFAEAELARINVDISDANITISNLLEKIKELLANSEKIEKQCASSLRKLNKSKELWRAATYSFDTLDRLTAAEITELDEIAPTVTLKLHCMDIRELRKAYKDNEKQINTIVERYKDRYTTKAYRTIYDLMVIALRAELQNIVYNLKYEKLEVGIDNVKSVTAKYLSIATSGNQNIASTVTRFIGEIEYLFINAVKIEYNYYVKKEQARQEQIALREQMRQEAAERKALELEQKRIEAEEQKYKEQLELLREKMEQATEEDQQMLQQEIAKVECNLSDVVLKKDEIAKLQHGKAGFIYIISNLGSFGEDVFKIGMTRRTDPQERVNELGSASVPFKFDVHSFIFSEDAVSLEKELHNRLNDKRVNKVNMYKEFFRTTVDELEILTNEVSPSAEFTKTMLAEEFRQSLSSEENYTSDFIYDDEDE